MKKLLLFFVMVIIATLSYGIYQTSQLGKIDTKNMDSKLSNYEAEYNELDKKYNELFNNINNNQDILNSYETKINNYNQQIKELKVKNKDYEYETVVARNKTLNNLINSYKATIKEKENNFNATTPSKPMESNATGDKVVYLTFDDGPSSNTLKILDILKKYNIKATFFVNGKTDDYSMSIYKRTKEEGHNFGNHTYSHNYAYIYKNAQSFESDYNKLQTEIFDKLGINTNIMRYPGGSNNTVSHKYGGANVMESIIRNMNTKGYVYFDWNVDSGDASSALTPKNTIINNVKKGVTNKNNAIILFHDTKAKTTTVEALPTIIEYLIAEGYKFEVLTSDSFNRQFATYK